MLQTVSIVVLASIFVSTLITPLHIAHDQSYLATEPPRKMLVIFIAGVLSDSTHYRTTQWNDLIVNTKRHFPDAELRNYSYKGRGEPYGPADTLAPVSDDASQLLENLRSIGVQGKDVYLIAHSLGGVVASYFATKYSQELDGMGGRLAEVITLDSPVRGFVYANNPCSLNIFFGLGEDIQSDFLHLVNTDLAPNSETINAISSAPSITRMTNISSMQDCAVLSESSELEGARNILVDSGENNGSNGAADSHGAVLKDPIAQARVFEALGEPLTAGADGSFFRFQGKPFMWRDGLSFEFQDYDTYRMYGGPADIESLPRLEDDALYMVYGSQRFQAGGVLPHPNFTYYIDDHSVLSAQNSVPAIPPDGTLVRGSTDAVYVMENGQRRLIPPDQATLSAVQGLYGTTDIQTLTDEQFAQIPQGPDWPIALVPPGQPIAAPTEADSSPVPASTGRSVIDDPLTEAYILDGQQCQLGSGGRVFRSDGLHFLVDGHCNPGDPSVSVATEIDGLLIYDAEIDVDVLFPKYQESSSMYVEFRRRDSSNKYRLDIDPALTSRIHGMSLLFASDHELDGRKGGVLARWTDRDLVSQPGWNRISIRAVGDTLTISVNDVIVMSLMDARFDAGGVRLAVTAPVNAPSTAPTDVSIRNLKITDLSGANTQRVAVYAGPRYGRANPNSASAPVPVAVATAAAPATPPPPPATPVAQPPCFTWEAYPGAGNPNPDGMKAAGHAADDVADRGGDPTAQAHAARMAYLQIAPNDLVHANLVFVDSHAVAQVRQVKGYYLDTDWPSAVADGKVQRAIAALDTELGSSGCSGIVAERMSSPGASDPIPVVASQPPPPQPQSAPQTSTQPSAPPTVDPSDPYDRRNCTNLSCDSQPSNNPTSQQSPGSSSASSGTGSTRNPNDNQNCTNLSCSSQPSGGQGSPSGQQNSGRTPSNQSSGPPQQGTQRQGSPPITPPDKVVIRVEPSHPVYPGTVRIVATSNRPVSGDYFIQVRPWGGNPGPSKDCPNTDTCAVELDPTKSLQICDSTTEYYAIVRDSPGQYSGQEYARSQVITVKSYCR